MTPVLASTAEAMNWIRAVSPAVFSERHDLCLDSRRLKRGDVFVAVPGEQSDGRHYLPSAAERGAAAALVDADGWTVRTPPLPVAAVKELRRSLGPLGAEFYGNPSERLLSIGVTGTNGKTSSSQWIAQVLTGAGRRCAVIGTLGSGFVDGPLTSTALTTPDPISLQRELRQLLDAGAAALAMEVSSIGLDQGRVGAMKFDVALFTNLTRDHLDYHATMERYEAAKAMLFDWPTLSHAVINFDDSAGRRLLPRLGRPGLRVIGFSSRDGARDGSVDTWLAARDIRATRDGLAFTLVKDRECVPVETSLVGQFNVANLLGVIGVTLACGLSFEAAVAALPSLTPPAGRMHRVATDGGPLAIVDYAHTPDALTQALAALRPLVQQRGGRLWVVFGAGGDRDPGKRVLMGAAAAAGSDVVVVTSDNPRSESPEGIVNDIVAGASAAREVLSIVDRGAAIERALGAAAAADVVLIAGKGHEDYQIIGNEKNPFSDVEHAQRALARRKATA